MSEKTDALEELLDTIERTSFLIGMGEGNLNIRLERDAARRKIIAEIAGIEAELDALRGRLMEYQQAAKMDIAPMLREALTNITNADVGDRHGTFRTIESCPQCLDMQAIAERALGA